MSTAGEINQAKMKYLTALILTSAAAVVGWGPTTSIVAATLPTSTTNVTVAVLASDPTALVGASSAAFTFVRSGTTNSDLVVQFSYSGTAVLGTDFNETDSHVDPTVQPPGPRYIVIPKGLYASDIVVQPLLNPQFRGNKTIDVTLDPVQLAASSATVENMRGKAEVRIVDDTYNDTPPIVSLIAPENNTTYTLPATVVITSDVIDTEDTVQRVSFYANDTFLGSSVTNPFTFTWPNPDVGDYDLFARAVDSAGKSALSQPVHITVKGVTPTVTILSPLDKAVYDPLADVPIKVDATGGGNLTVRVSYDTTHVLSDLTQPPYVFTWSKAPAGKHTISAKVTDSFGLTASASVQISVVDKPPTVDITSPATGASFVEGTPITLTARATDPDDSIKDVTFWVNHKVLGKANVSATDKSSYQFTWSGAKPNFYMITAVATNSNGTTATSDAIYISVTQQN
jgi:hypothetical protein